MANRTLITAIPCASSTLLVDAADAARVRAHTWCVGAGGDPVAKIGGATVCLHRWLLDAPDGLDVIHRNGDRLDCRRDNLALVTRSQSTQRKPKAALAASPYKGVAYHPRSGRWRASIHPQGRNLHLGYFDTDVEAALAYDAAAREHYGATARLNFPDVAGDAPPKRAGRLRISRRKGVSAAGPGRWRAVLCADGQRIHLGYFATEDEAAAAWEQAKNAGG